MELSQRIVCRTIKRVGKKGGGGGCEKKARKGERENRSINLRSFSALCLLTPKERERETKECHKKCEKKIRK
jgi:hypothetical protein